MKNVKISLCTRRFRICNMPKQKCVLILLAIIENSYFFSNNEKIYIKDEANSSNQVSDFKSGYSREITKCKIMILRSY